MRNRFNNVIVYGDNGNRFIKIEKRFL